MNNQVDGKTLSVPGEGEYVIDPNTGETTFTPETGFSGSPTTVDYQVTDDSGATDSGTISITVNDSPVATDDSAATNQDTPVTFNPLDNDTDSDGTLDPTSVVFINPPAGSTLTGDGKTLSVPGEGEYVIDPNTGETTFTPETGFSGSPTTVDYQVTDDSGATDSGTISITVNDSPVATDDSAATNQDTPVTFNPLDNDTDSDGTLDPTSVVFINPPAGSTLTGDGKTLSVPGEGEYVIDPNTGETTFTPETGFSGSPTTVDYQVTDDSGATDSGTISITVNDSPVATDDSAATNQDTPVTFNPLDNDTDSDGTLDPTSVVFINPPAGSTLTGDGKTLSVPGEGEYVIDPNTGETTFTPETGFSGSPTTVDYQVTDDSGATDSGTISITVNDSPVATDDSAATNQDTPVTFNPLDNDTDSDGTLDPTSVVFINPPAGSTLTGDGKTLSVPGEGEYVIDPNTGETTFTPETGFSGSPTTVDYQVTDDSGATDSGTISITVNDSPVATDDSAATNQDTPVTFNPLDNDTDSDGTLDPTSVVFINPPAGSTLTGDGKTLSVPGEGEYVIDPNTGETTFTPETGFSGSPTTVDYQVTDDSGATDSGTISIAVNEETPTFYSLSGEVLEDIDNNGTFGTEDTGIEGVTIELFANDGKGNPVGDVLKTATTDSDGFYEFTELLNDDYLVIQTQPENFDSVSDTDGANDNQIAVTILDDNTTGHDFLETPVQNVVEGTASPDLLVGTSTGDKISGYKGQDTLTGGAGRDEFFYTETSDGIDIITDFTTGEDQIDLSQIIDEELTYTGSDPIADGLVVIENYGSAGTMIQIDFDSNGELLPKDVVFLDGVDDINPDTDFIF